MTMRDSRPAAIRTSTETVGDVRSQTGIRCQSSSRPEARRRATDVRLRRCNPVRRYPIRGVRLRNRRHITITGLSDRHATFRPCPRSRAHRAPPPPGRPLVGRLPLHGAQVPPRTQDHWLPRAERRATTSWAPYVVLGPVPPDLAGVGRLPLGERRVVLVPGLGGGEQLL